MSKYIPLEIQEEILKRLPVKPLIRFRSVSKPWKSLIDSPDFIPAYGVRQTHPGRFILRYYPDENRYIYTRYITLVDNDDDDDDSFVQQDFVPAILDLVKKLVPGLTSVVGSSHGLLCFYRHETRMVVIWNPSIRKSVGVQVPDMLYDYPPKENFCNVFGFGVCPVTFDPTILKIRCTYYRLTTEAGISFPWNVRVFTLSTGSWSDLSTNLPRESISLRGSQVVIDRFIYWVALDTVVAEGGLSQSLYLIVSFDLTAQEFKEINLPDSLTDRSCRIRTISKLRECLVLLEYGFVEDVSCLWMMKEQGVSRSFTKLYNIKLPIAKINQILGFRKTGELIMERFGFQGSAEVQVYQPNREYTRNLGIHGAPYLFFMCSYLETLLLRDQSDGYIYTNSM